MRTKARWLAVLCALVLACGPGMHGKGPGVVGEGRTPASVEVTDDAFAGAVRDLLTSPDRSPERETRLQGVVARQMDRAAALFHRKATDRGLAAVTGGLYLLRVGDLKPGTLGPHGVEALNAAVKELSTRGDEGRARALYEILLRIAPAEQADVKWHLDALATWTRDGDDPSLGSASDRQHVAVARALLEPSQAALDEATAANGAWLARSLRVREGGPLTFERVEAARARQAAGTTTLALYIRQGDARGALTALEHDELLGRSASLTVGGRRFHAAVGALADKPSGDRWLEVLKSLAPSRLEDPDADDPIIDRELLWGAMLTAASEAYRADPTALEPALTIAELLQKFEMGEASPAILADACKAHPDAATLGYALQITAEALDAASEADDPDGARRTFRAAGPILDIAEHVKPPNLKVTPAHVRGVMGEIELRDGRLEVARDLLRKATAAEPSTALVLDLAKIERHDGDEAGALAHLRSAYEAASEPVARAEVALSLADVLRAKKDDAGARQVLGDALKPVLAQRGASHDPLVRARTERALARLFDRFGLTKRADDAIQRALEAAPRDKAQLAATLGIAGSRALVRGDLAAARDTLSHAVGADLDDEDVVYYALWERAVERQTRAPSDGVAERVFASIPSDRGWASKLAAFGAGRLRAEDLLAAATSPSKKAEALFYAALDKRLSDRPAADELLKQVAAGPGVDLIESDVARQLLAPMAPLQPPAGVAP
ncbi:MAG TPA: hypothetical protein VLM85_19280 [Polyangiaceae bacterium]|nr:hypothetical protein [Polyangiaceae bacterium]